jgi:DNA polymerase-3 subunit alpha (Gram-positive type)
MNNSQVIAKSVELMDELEFCVIDLETTGGNLKTDRIIEIGMVTLKGFKVMDTKSYYINPEKKIPEFIQKLTSISDADVKDAPKIHEVLDEILAFMGKKIIVAHNVSFDIPFLNSVIKKNKKSALENHILCTNVMTKLLIPGIMNSNLPYLCDIFNINHARAHHALSDAKATADLLIFYLTIFKQRGLKKINQIYYPKNKFELDRLHLNFTESSWDQLAQKLKTIQTTLFLSLKNKTGEILFATFMEPKTDFSKEIEAFKSYGLTATTLSLKLYGSQIEAMIHLKETYYKASEHVKKLILDHLDFKFRSTEAYTEWEKLKSHWGAERYSNAQQYFNHECHLIICKHLIDGQYLLLAAPYFNPQQGLVFKLPSQKRKIQQFISQILRRDASNLKVHEMTFGDEYFFPYWIMTIISVRQNKNYQFIRYADLGKGQEEMENLINKFTEKNKIKHRFPLNYLY